MTGKLFLLALVIVILVGCTFIPTSPPTTEKPSDIPSDTPKSSPSPTPPPPAVTPTDTRVPEPQGQILIVDSVEDRGSGSLRQALLDAQPEDTILFDVDVFPPDAPETIAVESELPHINQGFLTIDASDAGVILDGSLLPEDSWIPGLQIVDSEVNIIRGLFVTNFTGTGIAVAGNSENNTIGGDRNIGQGPFGQGNQCVSNAFGIGVWNNASNNTISGNYVGTNAAGEGDLGNRREGVWVTEGGRENVIGPDNIIAFNRGAGIVVENSSSTGNTLTQNSIHDNRQGGLRLLSGGNNRIDPPIVFEVNLKRGLLTGSACAGCTVEVFSDSADQGAVYEGQTVADSQGEFSFEKDAPFSNDSITSTATDIVGNTSEFSSPAGPASEAYTMQIGNSIPAYWLQSKPSSQLVEDTRLGWGLYSSNIWNDIPNLAFILNDYTDLGVKRLDTSMQEIEEPIDWSKREFVVSSEYDQFINDLNDNGIAVNYMLHFWDKEGHEAGETLSTPRFKEQDQIDDFLLYVEFVVIHFKGRVQYYTIWSEPDACGGTNVKCIEPHDYIKLARQTIPAIKAIDPEAKVVTAPNVLYYDRDYLFNVLSSDVADEFDVVSWHGIYDAVPKSAYYGDYYYEYPAIINEIKQTATNNGFVGEFWGTELTWCSLQFPTCHAPDQPWEIQETDKIAAKYNARGFVIQLGMDVGVGWGGLETSAAPYSYPTVRNLNTIMAGSEPKSLPFETDNQDEHLVSYAFTQPDGDILFALWLDGVAVHDFPSVRSTLKFPNLSADSVAGLDVLNNFEQELIFKIENRGLVIPDLLVKDYPILLRFRSIQNVP